MPTYDELVLVANEDALERDAGRIRAFLAALARGTDDLERRPRRGDRRAARGQPRPRPQAAARVVEVTLPLFLPPEGKPYGWQDPKEWNAFAAWMSENKLIENVPDARDAFTNELLPGEGL